MMTSSSGGSEGGGDIWNSLMDSSLEHGEDWLWNATQSLQRNSGENFTVEVPYFPHYVRTISTFLCSIILFVGIIGNLLVPVVVWKNKDLRSSTNIFLVNLSVADLLILIVCLPTGLVELHSEPEVWILGSTMCKLVPFAELSVAHASVLTILAISLERYIAICRPLRANYTCTKQRAVVLCIGIWVVGLIVSSPIIALSRLQKMPYIDRTIRSTCLMEARTQWSTTYFLSSMGMFFFLPLFLLLGLYWVISRNLMSDPININTNCSAACRSTVGTDHPNMRARKQVVVMLATVVFFFFICLLPFRIFTLYIMFVPDETLGKLGEELYYGILYFCRVMFYFNSAVNPILYNVMSSKFREAFFKVLGCPTIGNGRARWFCRHLSRQSTFTTTSTSLKSNSHMYGQCGSVYSNYKNNSCRSDSFSGNNPRHHSAIRSKSGGGSGLAYYPCSGRPGPLGRQMSADASSPPVIGKMVKTASSSTGNKKVIIRANSVI